MIKESSVNLTRNRIVAMVAGLLSIALTINAYYANHTINNDGIRSLRAADAFLAGNTSLGFSIEEWPFYSLLLALLHRFSGVDLVTLAQTFSVLSFGILAYCFVRIVARYDASLRVQLLAVAVISSFPGFAGWRDAIIREHGFWVFLLLGFFSYVNYIDSKRLRYLMFWMLTVAGASIFRVEAIALFVLPLILHFPFERGGLLKKFSVAYSLPGIIAVFGLLSLLINPQLLEQFKLKIYLVDYLGSFPQRYREFVELANAISWQTVPFNSRDYLPVMLASGLVVMLVLTLINALSIVHVGAALPWLGAKQYRLLRHEHFKLWCFYLAVIFAYLLLFTLMRRFVASRYTLGWTLIAALLLPLAWSYLWEHGVRRLWLNAKLCRVLICVIFFFATVHVIILPYRYPKAYVDEAAHWLRRETSGNLYTNNHHLAYFARSDFDWQKIHGAERLKNLHHVDMSDVEWFAVMVDRPGELQLLEDRLQAEGIAVTKVKVFSDKRIQSDRVVIFHRIPEQHNPEPLDKLSDESVDALPEDAEAINGD